MIVQAELFNAVVSLLHDLPPYEQCRHIVQMVQHRTLTHEQGKELLYALVDYEIGPTAH